MIHRIIADILIQVDLILVPDRIGLQEPSERRRVHPCLVIIHAELGEERLAGVAEPLGLIVAAVVDAIFVIGVGAVGDDRAGGAVGDADDRAQMIGMEVADDAERRARVPDERIVGRGVGAVDVALGEVAALRERLIKLRATLRQTKCLRSRSQEEIASLEGDQDTVRRLAESLPDGKREPAERKLNHRWDLHSQPICTIRLYRPPAGAAAHSAVGLQIMPLSIFRLSNARQKRSVVRPLVCKPNAAAQPCRSFWKLLVHLFRIPAQFGTFLG